MLYVTFQGTPPSPTARTDHHKDLKFGMDTHARPNRGATEAIFDKLPQNRDMGQKCPNTFFRFFSFFRLSCLAVLGTRKTHYNLTYSM